MVFYGQPNMLKLLSREAHQKLKPLHILTSNQTTFEEDSAQWTVSVL